MMEKQKAKLERNFQGFFYVHLKKVGIEDFLSNYMYKPYIWSRL